MRKLARFIFIVCTSLFIFNGSVIAQVTDTIIGAFDRNEFLNDSYKEWYVEEYKNYELNFEILDQIQVPDDLELLIYLGTWCGDSRREVPRLPHGKTETGESKPYPGTCQRMAKGGDTPDHDGNDVTLSGTYHVDYTSHHQETQCIRNHKNTIDDPVLFFCPTDTFLKIRSKDSEG